MNGQIMELQNVPVLPVSRVLNKVVGTTATRIVAPDNQLHKLVLLSDKNGFNVRPGNCVALTVTADNTTDTFTCANHQLQTGFGPYRIASSGTLPAGTAGATDYYIIWTGANTFKLATSLLNANKNTAVDITSNGSGTITIADPVAMPSTEFPATSVTDGSGAFYIPDKGNLVMNGIKEVTVKGYAADSVLTYYWVT